MSYRIEASDVLPTNALVLVVDVDRLPSVDGSWDFGPVSDALKPFCDGLPREIVVCVFSELGSKFVSLQDIENITEVAAGFNDAHCEFSWYIKKPNEANATKTLELDTTNRRGRHILVFEFCGLPDNSVEAFIRHAVGVTSHANIYSKDFDAVFEGGTTNTSSSLFVDVVGVVTRNGVKFYRVDSTEARKD